jgi:hypothetical protein
METASSPKPTAEEIQAWHAENVGMSGRSHDPERVDRACDILLPNDADGAWRKSYLFGWMHDGHLTIASTCALYGMAYLRWRGCADLYPLNQPYRPRVSMCVGDLQQAAQKIGAWKSDNASLTTFPSPGDIVEIGGYHGASDVHFVCVTGSDDNGLVLSVDGGQVDNSYTQPCKHMMVIWQGNAYFVHADAPYLKSGVPNGRIVTGKVDGSLVAEYLAGR